jgi:hypothetical protein
LRLGDRVTAGVQYDFRDQLDEEHYLRDGEELHAQGLFVRREGGGAHLFDVKPA